MTQLVCSNKINKKKQLFILQNFGLIRKSGGSLFLINDVAYFKFGLLFMQSKNFIRQFSSETKNNNFTTTNNFNNQVNTNDIIKHITPQPLSRQEFDYAKVNFKLGMSRNPYQSYKIWLKNQHNIDLSYEDYLKQWYIDQNKYFLYNLNIFNSSYHSGQILGNNKSNNFIMILDSCLPCLSQSLNEKLQDCIEYNNKNIFELTLNKTIVILKKYWKNLLERIIKKIIIEYVKPYVLISIEIIKPYLIFILLVIQPYLDNILEKSKILAEPFNQITGLVIELISKVYVWLIDRIDFILFQDIFKKFCDLFMINFDFSLIYLFSYTWFIGLFTFMIINSFTIKFNLIPYLNVKNSKLCTFNLFLGVLESKNDKTLLKREYETTNRYEKRINDNINDYLDQILESLKDREVAYTYLPLKFEDKLDNNDLNIINNLFGNSINSEYLEFIKKEPIRENNNKLSRYCNLTWSRTLFLIDYHYKEYITRTTGHNINSNTFHGNFQDVKLKIKSCLSEYYKINDALAKCNASQDNIQKILDANRINKTSTDLVGLGNTFGSNLDQNFTEQKYEPLIKKKINPEIPLDVTFILSSENKFIPENTLELNSNKNVSSPKNELVDSDSERLFKKRRKKTNFTSIDVSSPSEDETTAENTLPKIELIDSKSKRPFKQARKISKNFIPIDVSFLVPSERETIAENSVFSNNDVNSVWDKNDKTSASIASVDELSSQLIDENRKRKRELTSDIEKLSHQMIIGNETKSETNLENNNTSLCEEPSNKKIRLSHDNYKLSPKLIDNNKSNSEDNISNSSSDLDEFSFDQELFEQKRKNWESVKRDQTPDLDKIFSQLISENKTNSDTSNSKDNHDDLEKSSGMFSGEVDSLSVSDSMEFTTKKIKTPTVQQAIREHWKINSSPILKALDSSNNQSINDSSNQMTNPTIDPKNLNY
jgi:hypothetical protein